MQFKNKEFDPKLHDRWFALTVKQPYATQLVTESFEVDGEIYAEKSIEVRSRNTSYRGDVMICSSCNPVIHGYMSGVTLGIVELYGVKPVSEFDLSDWERTRIPLEKYKKITKGYGWLMRNPRRVVEFPVKGQLGIYNLVYTRDTILEYPRKATDADAKKILNKKLEKWSKK